MVTMDKVLNIQSARLERYLQMYDDHPFKLPVMEADSTKQSQEINWQVVNVTTPANYFHVLRRQIHRDFRKPMIAMAPKNLSRHQKCRSSISEFEDTGENGFQRLIKDVGNHKEKEDSIRRVVFCTGKIYYELDEERERAAAKDVAICRVEQICPFPFDLVSRELKRYPKAEVVWCQEEPMNMGAFLYVFPRLGTSMKNASQGKLEDIKYAGRPAAASPATGFGDLHTQEQKGVVARGDSEITSCFDRVNA